MTLKKERRFSPRLPLSIASLLCICRGLMATATSLVFHVKGDLAIVALAAELPLLDLLHGDLVGPLLHFKDFGMAHVAAETNAVYPVGEDRIFNSL